MTKVYCTLKRIPTREDFLAVGLVGDTAHTMHDGNAIMNDDVLPLCDGKTPLDYQDDMTEFAAPKVVWFENWYLPASMFNIRSA